MQRELRPFAIAANILQASSTRIDQVFLTVGNLFRLFSDPKIDPVVQKGVQSALETRWAKNVEKDIFILAVVFNPYIRGRAFRKGNAELTSIHLYNRARDVYTRLFQGAVPDNGFHAAFFDYMEARNEFSVQRMALDLFKKAHLTEVCRSSNHRSCLTDCSSA